MGLGWCLANALTLTEGHFALAMDDPYIHLALAENIARGTYGINLDEFASPASSMLWPFLLVPFAALGVGDVAALGWNALSTVVLSWILASVLWPATSDLGRLRGIVRVVVLAAVPFVLNLFAMAMLGMEHGLHIVLSLGVVVGVHQMLRDRALPPWLPLAVLTVGVVRYEALALSFCVIAVMFIVGHRKVAVLTALLLMGMVGGFSLYLHAQSDYWVPVSVLSKSGPMASGLAGERTLAQFSRNQATPEGQMLCAGTAWMLGVSLGAVLLTRTWRLVWMMPVLCTSVVAHLFLGRMDWFHRYELYLWAMLLVTTLLFVTGLRSPALRIAALLGTITFWTWQSWPYIRDLREVPVASQDTYEQQFQMHRFAVDYWKGPVAINDLGWVAYQNDAYVLDLWQLGSVASFRARVGRDVRAWAGLVTEHKVQVAMIYAHWFTEKQPMVMPATWIRLGSLVMSHDPVIANARAVQFFATDPLAEPTIRDAVELWSLTLPAGVAFHWKKAR